MIECVVNISEGRDESAVAAIAAAAARHDLLDLHSDVDHNRSVLTLLGEDAPRAVAASAVDRLDLRTHLGAHPRIGVVDVVPFAPLVGSTLPDAIRARDRFCSWAAAELDLPSFRYGPERSLPDVRRHAFAELTPDAGPATPHPSAGAVAVGARPVLVAYNVWLVEPDLSLARTIANRLRGPSVRALGLAVGSGVQVSFNLVDLAAVGPVQVADAVAATAAVDRCELVGLMPESVLETTPTARWNELDLSPDTTIEARLQHLRPNERRPTDR